MGGTGGGVARSGHEPSSGAPFSPLSRFHVAAQLPAAKAAGAF